MMKKFKYFIFEGLSNDGKQEICQANQKVLTENLKQFTDINQDIIEVYDKIKVFENSLQVSFKNHANLRIIGHH